MTVLIRGHWAPRIEVPAYRFSVALHEPKVVPGALNGLARWVVLMIALSIVNYGYPIGRLAALDNTSVPIVPMLGTP